MKKLFYILLFIIGSQITAQQKQMSLDDAVLGYWKGLYPESLRNLQWLKDADMFLYNNNNKIIIENIEGQKLFEIDLASWQKTFEKAKYLPYIETVTKDFWMFSGKNKTYLYDYHNKSYQVINMPENAENQDFCYKIKMTAYTVENNLYIADTQGNQWDVAVNENKNIVSGQAIARSEFGITKGTFWSPQANKLAFYQKDETNVEEYPLVDITETPAKLHNIKYPMNGRGSEEPAVGVYDIKTHKTVYLKLFDKAGKEHYATNLTWGPNERYIYLAEINRDQNHIWFNKYDAQTGLFIKTLFEETNDKWAEPEHPAFFIPHSNRFVWLSERDGFMNLYIYDDNGKFIKQLTRNKWVTNNVLGFSPDGKYVYTEGTGSDPRESHLFKIRIKNGKQKQLTEGEGRHSVQINKNASYFLDNYSSVRIPRRVMLNDTRKAKMNKILLKAKNPVTDYNINPYPEMFTIKGEYGDLLYARMFKPADFDPQKKYPVLVYVYGGPHAQLVTNRWLGGAPLWMPWLAAQGYIVFTVDGHGSANRGFAFESVIYRHLGQVEMKDQLHGVEYLKSLPYVDSKRLAVHGWSFGGFMTTSLMTTYPDVFTTGVAGGPVTEWKWYEVMYGERYMDTEAQNPEGFKETGVLHKIKNLKGKLLTIHGYQDDVVVPQHNIALHREAIKNAIQMDFYLYPTHTHNVRGKDRVHLMRKILDYIMENNK